MPAVPGQPSATNLAQQAAAAGQSLYGALAKARQEAERMEQSMRRQARQAQSTTSAGWFARLQSAAMGQAMAASRANAAQMQAQLAHLQSPGGAAKYQAMLGAQGREAVLQAQLQAARMQAAAQFAGSPQGHAQARAQQAAQSQAAAAQEEMARQRNVALYGRTGGALVNFKEQLGKAGKEFAPFIAALMTVAVTARHMAGLASPQHMQTLQDSLDLLGARIGRELLPAVEQMALVVQKTSSAFDNLPPVLQRLVRPGFAQPDWNDLNDQRRPVRAAGWNMALLGLPNALAGRPEMSMGAQSRLMGHEAYGENLMEQAASSEGDQRDRLLRLQLENMVGRLDRVVDNTDLLRRIVPQFR